MNEFAIPILVDAKVEYTKQLISILKPFIYDGIKSIFEEAKNICTTNKEPGNILLRFQHLLSDIPKWNNEIISKEVERIVTDSGCDWLEDLITAVFVSHTKILTAIQVNKKKKENKSTNT